MDKLFWVFDSIKVCGATSPTSLIKELMTVDLTLKPNKLLVKVVFPAPTSERITTEGFSRMLLTPKLSFLNPAQKPFSKLFFPF